jgi:lipopolysaccharide assembly outer membrane protein LptD (OstA)
VRLISRGVVIAVQFIVGIPGAVCQGNKDAGEKPHLRMETPYGKAVFLEAASLHQQDAAVKFSTRGDWLRPHASIIYLRGNVVIKTDCSIPLQGASPVCLVLRADEAEYHEDTGQIEAIGAVRLRFEANSK